MIDTENIRTASAYINNQLLSRGLLQDGQNIDFANPGKREDVLTTMGRIMSVVNDLILRRDKDAEQRESLANSMRTIRAENIRHVKEIDTLTEKNSESRRKLALAESSESALQRQLKSAEAAAKAQKEDLARQKALVAQTRAACATETRKRDRQIETLKKQLGEAGRARGARTNPAITTIQVMGDTGSAKGTPVRGSTTSSVNSAKMSGSNTAAAGSGDYSLRNETNAFLAKLSQDLNEENEAILTAMRKTMSQLRQMSGYDSQSASDEHGTRYPSWDDMAPELDAIIEHMKTILTNPSFVPIEEVIVRDEEIARLKRGWVKMEDRWQEAMVLIDGWRQRMVESGRGVDEEDLMMGLRLSPVKIREGMGASMDLSAIGEEEEDDEQEQEEDEDEDWMGARAESPCPSEPSSLHLLPADHHTQDFHLKDAHVVNHNEEAAEEQQGSPLEDPDASEPNFEVLAESGATSLQSLGSSPMPEPPQLSPLRNSNTAGNRGPLLQTRKLRKPTIDYSSITGEKKRKEPASPPVRSHERITKTRIPSGGRVPKPEMSGGREVSQQRSVSSTSLDEALLSPVKQPLPRQKESQQFEEPEDSNQEAAEVPTPSTHRLSDCPASTANKPASSIKGTPRRAAAAAAAPRLAHPEEEQTAAPQQSPLTMSTIAAKLAASEKEAAAARVRAKLRAARAAKTLSKPVLSAPASQEPSEGSPSSRVVTAESPAKRRVSPSKEGVKIPLKGGDDEEEADELAGDDGAKEIVKRKRDTRRRSSKVASRRRSTLSPLELQSLITGQVQ